MRKIYTGKTKNVFRREDGTLLLEFKDDVTGAEGRIDSGANAVVGSIPGKGIASLRLTVHFFQLLQSLGIPSHFVRMGSLPNSIVVRAAKPYGIEVICREKAWGSFVRRYRNHVAQGAPLASLVEFTLKDDVLGDPLITLDALATLNVASRTEIQFMAEAARKMTAAIKTDLATKALELIDIKYEFGDIDGQPILIDEISGDSMRVLKAGQVLLPHELAALLLADCP